MPKSHDSAFEIATSERLARALTRPALERRKKTQTARVVP